MDARNCGYDVSVSTPIQTVRWRWGGRTASGDRSVWAILLGGKLHGSVASGNPCFSGGKSY